MRAALLSAQQKHRHMSESLRPFRGLGLNEPLSGRCLALVQKSSQHASASAEEGYLYVFETWDQLKPKDEMLAAERTIAKGRCPKVTRVPQARDR